jgi:membrane protease subunit (stomatin/prohibitin family)
VEDPKSGIPVETMVHGEFSFKVEDPEKLIVGLVGTGRAQSFQVKSWLKEQVLKVLRDRTAELLVKKKWPLLDVTSGAYTEELEATVLAGMAAHVADYGVRIVRFGNFVVGIDEDDADNLKALYRDAAYLKTVGGVDQYQKFAAGKAMMGAGEGMAKGGGGGGGDSGLLQGASLGVGLGMAQMLVRDHRGGASLEPATPGVLCGSCMATVSAGKFCSACGESLLKKAASSDRHCGDCGETLSNDARFCTSCGHSQED